LARTEWRCGAQRRLHYGGGRRLGATKEWALLRLCGYDLDNMKARGLVEAEMPLLFPPEGAETSFAVLAGRLIEGAKAVASLTLGQIKAAGGAATNLDLIRERFFAESQSAFFAAVEQALDARVAQPEPDDIAIRKAWLDETLAPLAPKNLWARGSAAGSGRGRRPSRA
jgi:CRISPR system Cascade subunit CasA